MLSIPRPFGVLLLVAAMPSWAMAQIPSEFENLQVLPSDISRDSLILTMRSFSFATGLLCEGCHVMGEGGSFEGARFDLDDKRPKRQARFMIQMMDRLNREILPDLPERDEPPLQMECKTCHRGIRKPFLLRTELRRIVHEEGVDAAVERYRQLREGAAESGRYDFGEWEMNELARELEAEGDLAGAAAILELNEEFHSASPSIPRLLGALYERLGRTTDALGAYARALGRNPTNAAARDRVRALLEGGMP